MGPTSIFCLPDVIEANLWKLTLSITPLGLKTTTTQIQQEA